MADQEVVASTIKERAIQKLERDMGTQMLTALHDPRTQEIMLNPDGTLWQWRLGEPMRCIGSFSANRGEAIIKTVAGYLGKEVTRVNPILEGEFPLDGSRFSSQIPPIVQGGPAFSIRKKAVSIFTLEEYLESGTLTPRQYETLIKAVRDHRNILVSGSTGSGKTTLVNAVINEMVKHDPSERLLIIEDTGEIQCSAKNYVQYHTTIDVSMTMLLKVSLRMRPDRILVGEVRGGEALDLLMAWNTGHEGGIATLHANSARESLSRLSLLCSMATNPPNKIEPLIGEAVHLVVHIAKTPEGRRIQEIIEVSGYADGQYKTQTC